MAIFDFNRLGYGVNEDDIIARVLSYGPIKALVAVSPTATSFTIDPPGRLKIKYEGEDFKYNSKGDPTKGIIESVQVVSPNHPEESFKITELNVDIAALKASGGATLLSIFDGNDTFIGSRKDDKLYGLKGKDTMNGSDGKDSLEGGNGNDVLNGGRHADSLTGGAGKDSFVFDTAISKGDNVDVIVDFDALNDTIKLDDKVFSGLGTGVLDASLFHVGDPAAFENGGIIYDPTTGALWYDVEGKHAYQFATLQNMPTDVTNADFVII